MRSQLLGRRRRSLRRRVEGASQSECESLGGGQRGKGHGRELTKAEGTQGDGREARSAVFLSPLAGSRLRSSRKNPSRVI